jgi:hypothetical protein
MLKRSSPNAAARLIDAARQVEESELAEGYMYVMIAEGLRARVGKEA